MENTGGQYQLLEMRLSEIKTYLSETLGKPFKEFGYTFKKTGFIFKKKIGNNTVEFLFDFINYAPLRYEINFSINVMNKDIQDIKNSSPVKPSGFNYNAQSVYFYLGDFIEGIKQDLNNNVRRHFAYSVTTARDLFNAAEKI